MNASKMKKDKAGGRRGTEFETPETTAGADDFFNMTRESAVSIATSRKSTMAEGMNFGGENGLEKKIAHETET